jgi:glycosyltransferase involved in cell wall biosynthesis
MKIIHAINNLKAGGAQTFVVSLAIEQSSAGNTVWVVVVDKITDPTFENNLINLLSKNNISVLFLDRKIGRSPSIIKCFFKLARIVKESGADIINSHLEFTHFTVGAYISIAKFFLKKQPQHVLTIHNAPENWGNFTLLFNRKTTTIYCSKAALSTCIQRDCKKMVIENGIPQPVITEVAKRILHSKNIDPSKKLVLLVGKLSRQKNYALLIEIAKEMEGQNITFLVCGMAGDTAEQDLANFKKVKNITYLGVLVPEEIHALMAVCDCFLNTSIHEGLPITVLEAFFIGIPCVLSPILPHKEIADLMPHCFITESFEAASFVTIIDGLIFKHEDKSKIIKLRQEKLKLFDIGLTAKRYLEFYQLI